MSLCLRYNAIRCCTHHIHISSLSPSGLQGCWTGHRRSHTNRLPGLSARCGLFTFNINELRADLGSLGQQVFLLLILLLLLLLLLFTCGGCFLCPEQDVSQRRKKEGHQAVAFIQGRCHFPCGEDDEVPAHRHTQIPHRYGGTSLHGSSHRVPGRWVASRDSLSGTVYLVYAKNSSYWQILNRKSNIFFF